MAVDRCTRCGTARRGDLQVCVRCETPFADGVTDLDADVQRPAAPSVIQTHGTMAAVVVVGVVLMGLIFSFSVRKVGPFKGEILSQRPNGAGVTLTVRVSNAGERAGRGNCRVKVSTSGGRVTNVAPFITQRIAANGTVTQDVEVPTEDGAPAEVTCG
ncbi:MAG: hypothetical protein ABIM89_01230 [Mycobacteriales bacterium]